MINAAALNPGATSCWRSARAIAVAGAIGLLAACGGAEDDGAPAANPTAAPGPVVRLEVSPASVLLTAAGQTRSLRVKAYDAAGVEVPNPPLSFSSSRPEQVSVAADGTLGAVVASGSALIEVTSGTVTATPVLAAATQPADGVQLVADEQVLAAPQPLAADPAAPADAALRYRVRLAGAGLPAAGTLLLGTGAQPVAGRVVSATAVGDQADVVLETVPLATLFKSVSIDLAFTPQQTEPWFQEAPALAAPASARKRAAGVLDDLSCEGTIRRDLLAIDQKLKVKDSLAVDLKYRIEDAKVQEFHVAAKGSVAVSGKMSVKVVTGITGDVTCKLLLGAVIIPVTGPLSIALAPVVPIQAKFKLEGQFGIAALTLSGELKNTATMALALDYLRGTGLQPKLDGSLDSEVKFDVAADTSGSARVKLTGFMGLTSGIALGNVLQRLDVVQIDAGPELEARFGGEYDVSQDAGYDAGYDAKYKVKIGPGSAIKKAITNVLGEDLVAFDMGFSYDKVFARTAKPSSITIDRNTFAKGDKVAFAVDLDASTVNFPFVGYNVKEVRIYRLVRDSLPTAVLVATAPAVAGQTHFDLDWIADMAGTATEPDSGREMFYAFVVDTALAPVSQFVPFELGPVTGKMKPPLFRLTAGGDMLFAIGADDRARSIGANNGGGLGAGLPIGQVVTAPADIVNGTNAVSVTGSAWFGAMLRADGTVWAWGWGPSIGIPGRDNPQPILIQDNTPLSRNLSISSGHSSTAVVTSSGRIFRFGDTVSHSAVAFQPGAVAAAEGIWHTLILTNDGKVHGWGDNSSGQLANSLLSKSYGSPVTVEGLSGIVAVAAGDFFSLALKDDGTVWAWGSNVFGQLGLGLAPGIIGTPLRIPGLTGVVKISAGENHAMALTADGTVYSWGLGQHCRLGTGDQVSRNAPQAVFSGASDIDAGEFGSAYLRDGVVWRAGHLQGLVDDACVPEPTSLQGSVK